MRLKYKILISNTKMKNLDNLNKNYTKSGWVLEHDNPKE